MNLELPDVQPGFKEAEESEIKSPTFAESWRKQGSSRKTSSSTSLTTLKLLTVWVTTNFGKFFKRWDYQITLPVSEKPVCRSRSKLQPDMEQRTSSKLGKECIKAVYCHPAYLTYMQSTSCEMLGWMKHKLESRLLEKYQQPQICR